MQDAQDDNLDWTGNSATRMACVNYLKEYEYACDEKDTTFSQAECEKQCGKPVCVMPLYWYINAATKKQKKLFAWRGRGYLFLALFQKSLNNRGRGGEVVEKN